MKTNVPVRVAIVIAVGVLIWHEAARGQGAAEDPTTIEINYFQRFITDGGPITWFILIPGSVATGSLVIQGFAAIRRANFVPEALQQQLHEWFEARNFREAIEATATEPTLLGRIVHAGLSEASRGYAAMDSAVVETGDEQSTRVLRKIEFLNLIGNVSPMVGLFGTVFGMIEAFNAIVAVGGAPEPAKLAEGISIALVTTFWGLLVAIPALFFYALFRNRLDALTEESVQTAQQLLAVFRPGGTGGAPPTIESAGAAKP